MNNRQTVLNLLANMIAFAVQMGVNFIVTPIIIRKVGIEAYGFVGLANDFVTYLSVLTVILNSVSSRFISLEIHRQNIRKANQYFNSVLVANVMLSGLFLILGMVWIPNIHRFVNVPAGLLGDVRLTFALTFVTYIVTTGTSVFLVATFVKNRMDIGAIRNIISYLIRLVVILLLFLFLPVKMYFISIAALVSNIFLAIANLSITRRLLPEIKIDPGMIRIQMVKELAASGGWMAFTNVSNILIKGLDLLLSNILISSVAMGMLSTARTVPNAVSGLIGTIGYLFTPVLVQFYAKGNQEGLSKEVDASVQLCSCAIMAPVTVFIVFSHDFYQLWLHGRGAEEISVISLLSTITILQAYFNAATYPIAQLSVVTNRLKMPVLVCFATGVVNVIAVYLLATRTGLGIYAMVCSSTVLLCTKYLFFDPIYGAKVLGLKWNAFYGPLLKAWSPLPLLFLLCHVIKRMADVHSWFHLILVMGICTVAGYGIILWMTMRKRILKRKE